MNSITRSRPLLSALVLAAAASGLCSEAHGQERHEFRGARVELDARYHHDRYYPARGYLAERLPTGSLGIAFGSGQYFFHAGVWFRPVGARFEVITPPLGIEIPLLPPGFVTLSIGGLTYYYADGVYYAAAPIAGYIVVSPPPGADTAQAIDAAGATPQAPAVVSAVPAGGGATPPARAPIVYPRNGQTAAQLDADQKQCRQWAASQIGAAANASVLDRALDACLDGRGYTVR